jgi:replicative DNA helicase
MISTNIEAATLGNMLEFPETMDAVEINPEVFMETKNLKIARKVLELKRQGTPVSRLTVAAELPEFQDYIWQVGDDIGHGPSLPYYYKQLVIKYKLTLTKEASKAFEEESKQLSPEEALDKFHARLDPLRRRSAEQLEWLAQTFDEVLDNLDKPPTLMPTSFAKINEVIDGFRPGAVYVVAARPGVGKTMLGMEFAHYAAHNHGVLFFSMEMSKQELAKRIISSVSNVTATEIFKGNIEQESWKRIANSRSKIAEGLMIDDRPGTSVDRIRAVFHKAVAERPIDMIVIDYLGLMEDVQASKSRYEKVTNISNDVKRLARELNVPIIALHQLNRAVENRSEPRPTLSDLRDSGAIEQDADVVMLLHRDQDADGSFMSELKVAIAKNRHGTQGLKTLQIHPSYMRIVD